MIDEAFKHEVLKRLEAGALRMERFERDLHADTRERTARMTRFETDLHANTTATKAIAEWMTAWEGAIKVLDGLAKIAKPVGIMAGAIGAIGAMWLAIKHGLGFDK